MNESRFLRTHPVLPSLDLDRTTRFYEEHFGFRPWKQRDDVVVLSRDQIELNFCSGVTDTITRSHRMKQSEKQFEPGIAKGYR